MLQRIPEQFLVWSAEKGRQVFSEHGQNRSYIQRNRVMTNVQIATAFAFSMLGVPYIYGGQSRAGTDCSGLVQQILDQVGLDPKNDQNAQALFNILKTKQIEKPCEGRIVFFGSKITRIHHVGYCISEDRMIEAAHGTSLCTTVEYSKKIGAQVEINLITRLSDRIAVVNPFA